MSKKLILLVEDDKTIRKFISTALTTQDYDVKEAITGKEGISIAVSYSPDVVLLDLGLEDMDGIEVIKAIRQFSNIPIIVVSAREQDREKVEVFDAGADDYLTKPFSIVELLARVRVAFRHSQVELQQKEEIRSTFEVGELFIDFDKRKVIVDNNEVHLTPIEYNILSLLAKHHGKVLTHNFIIKEIWGSIIGNETKSLRVFMATLRRKIEKQPADPRYIITEVGVGYRLNDE
ncbi:response regulator transcription factor [Clostridioides sp. ES-S-0005-03]|uniref:response regulator n=1 Tax=unclassified Clostridioides TaxID=2635829 RepID=UPI001D0C548C|nr:response regulator transcription factor [Clostridioides sp. ES-S-0001-03]MCC0655284.1 response regulator transcription factor [Clostridioides sp. ES-S-0123-01]MCC0671259.1 response regulator transcription factor [Clostridioides sp. ES-S-0145-01]MCC0679464.1 response regulator transcription factor [Clostridioides sp. ES-S-0005-03]MCC0702379.1 response regulator transcription factor [Clostridioides sp. ES-S-0049-02]UDN49256.1 response regulator transcription factor [Clostridioides sp. ES-S-01